MRDLDVLTVNTNLHRLPTEIFRAVRRINKGMSLKQDSVEISGSQFQGRKIMDL